jgi:hypothetical protein
MPRYESCLDVTVVLCDSKIAIVQTGLGTDHQRSHTINCTTTQQNLWSMPTAAPEQRRPDSAGDCVGAPLTSSLLSPSLQVPLEKAGSLPCSFWSSRSRRHDSTTSATVHMPLCGVKAHQHKSTGKGCHGACMHGACKLSARIEAQEEPERLTYCSSVPQAKVPEASFLVSPPPAPLDRVPLVGTWQECSSSMTACTPEFMDNP